MALIRRLHAWLKSFDDTESSRWLQCFRPSASAESHSTPSFPATVNGEEKRIDPFPPDSSPFKTDVFSCMLAVLEASLVPEPCEWSLLESYEVGSDEKEVSEKTKTESSTLPCLINDHFNHALSKERVAVNASELKETLRTLKELSNERRGLAHSRAGSIDKTIMISLVKLLGREPDLFSCLLDHYDDDEDSDDDVYSEPRDSGHILYWALLCAVEEGLADCVEMLLNRRGAKILHVPPNAAVKRMSIHTAVQRGDERTVRLLLDASETIDRPNATSNISPRPILSTMVNADRKSGWAPLHSAVYGGYESIVELLLCRGADVNQSTSDKASPIHFAVCRASKSRMNVLRMIVEADGINDDVCWKVDNMTNRRCKIDHADRAGNTALHKAICSAKEEMVVHLVNYGVNLDLVNVNGYTPFHRAVDRSLFGVCRLLVEAGCDVTKESSWIQTEKFPKSLRRNSEEIKWLKSLISSPRVVLTGFSLQHQCRRVIRRLVCCRDVRRKVDALMLPKSLKKFILLDPDNEV